MRALCGWDSLIPGINPMATCLARCRCSADGSWVNECPHWTAAATEAQKGSVTYPKSHSSERPRRAWSPCCESKEEKRSGPVSRVSHPSTNQAWHCLFLRSDETRRVQSGMAVGWFLESQSSFSLSTERKWGEVTLVLRWLSFYGRYTLFPGLSLSDGKTSLIFMFLKTFVRAS